jgi:hypothetical protein
MSQRRGLSGVSPIEGVARPTPSTTRAPSVPGTLAGVGARCAVRWVCSVRDVLRAVHELEEIPRECAGDQSTCSGPGWRSRSRPDCSGRQPSGRAPSRPQAAHAVGARPRQHHASSVRLRAVCLASLMLRGTAPHMHTYTQAPSPKIKARAHSHARCPARHARPAPPVPRREHNNVPAETRTTKARRGVCVLLAISCSIGEHAIYLVVTHVGMSRRRGRGRSGAEGGHSGVRGAVCMYSEMICGCQRVAGISDSDVQTQLTGACAI